MGSCVVLFFIISVSVRFSIFFSVFSSIMLKKMFGFLSMKSLAFLTILVYYVPLEIKMRFILGLMENPLC